QAQLRHILVIHDDQPLVPVLHESDIGLNQPGGNLVVAQPRPRIECADIFEGRLHCLDWTSDGAPNLLELLQRYRFQMLIDYGNRIAHNRLGQGIAVRVQLQLLQMVAQLIEQAFPQVATGYAWRIDLAHYFQRFVQIGDREIYIRSPRWRYCRSRASSVAGRRQRDLGGLNRGWVKL